MAGFVRALVTGNRDNLTDEFTTSLERAGLSHTVAVSGMHLAFLASLLTALLGRGRRSTALFTVLWVALFCGIAGNTPSVLRAAVMILMLQLAPLLDRERDGPTSLALALFLLLWVNPFSAAHIGLQLSFTAVAGILLVSDRVQGWLLKKLRMDQLSKPRGWGERLLQTGPYFVVSTLSATLGASVLTIPLVALHFNMISLIAPQYGRTPPVQPAHPVGHRLPFSGRPGGGDAGHCSARTSGCAGRALCRAGPLSPVGD